MLLIDQRQSQAHGIVAEEVLAASCALTNACIALQPCIQLLHWSDFQSVVGAHCRSKACTG